MSKKVHKKVTKDQTDETATAETTEDKPQGNVSKTKLVVGQVWQNTKNAKYIVVVGEVGERVGRDKEPTGQLEGRLYTDMMETGWTRGSKSFTANEMTANGYKAIRVMTKDELAEVINAKGAATADGEKALRAKPKGVRAARKAEGKSGTIADAIKAQLLKGVMDTDEVLAAVKKEFPDSHTTPACVAYYKTMLRKEGSIAAVVRKDKTAKKVEAKAEAKPAKKADAKKGDAKKVVKKNVKK